MPVSGLNYFEFAADTVLTSSTYNMFVTGAVFGTPSRDVEKISVPGLNGDLIRDHGRFNNIVVTYECEIPNNFQTKIKLFNHDFGLTMPKEGWLTDSYDTGHYRVGRFLGATVPNVGYAADSGTVQVSFDCKPQIFVNRGTDITVSTTTTVTNPTGYEAWPILYWTHGGTATFTNSNGTGHSLTVDQSVFSNYTPLVIDCELKVCTNQAQTQNLNSYVSGIFPSLTAGTTTITVSNGAAFTMWPRWWTL